MSRYVDGQDVLDLVRFPETLWDYTVGSLRVVRPLSPQAQDALTRTWKTSRGSYRNSGDVLQETEVNWWLLDGTHPIDFVFFWFRQDGSVARSYEGPDSKKVYLDEARHLLGPESLYPEDGTPKPVVDIPHRGVLDPTTYRLLGEIPPALWPLPQLRELLAARG